MKYHQAANKADVLVLADNELTQRSLYEMLCRSGYAVETSSSAEEALAFLDENPRRIILADSNETGSDLLKAIGEKGYPTEVIILTSYGDIESAITSVRMGAYDYLVRPVSDRKIISAIEKAYSRMPSFVEEFAIIRDIHGKEKPNQGLIGNSVHIKNICSLIERISDTKATILLRGESGTGKRVIAHAIHKADKKRKDKPFIEISCGALPKEIIESELFGHTKGAFTGAVADRKGRFELAHESTILLDDIDAFSLDLQVKLLRVLQQKEFESVGDNKTIKVDVRIVASTNQNLEQLVEEGKFRKDLYYRLNVISIKVPPLRERKEDLPLFIQHFIELYSNENHRKIKHVSSAARDILTNYSWPGNIRELENIIERAVIVDTDNIIDKDDLPEVILNDIEILNNIPSLYQGGLASLKEVLKEPEKVYILKVLKEVGWNKKKAAMKLGVNRTTLYNKLRQYNLLASLNNE